MAAPELETIKAAALARLYDVDLIEDPGDVELYLALAARTGGPVLELAAGSGRVTVPLAAGGLRGRRRGLRRLDARPRSRRGRAAGPEPAAGSSWSRRTFSVSQLPGGARFQLAILALNSILLMGTIEDQSAALETMARHLAPGGLAVVDVWLPSGRELAGYDGRMSLEYVRQDPETGNQIVKMASASHEPAMGHVDLTVVYQEIEGDGSARTWTRTDRLRLLNAGDLAFLAESAGLEVEVLAGDYDLDPLGPHDERAILIARRRGGPASRA